MTAAQLAAPKVPVIDPDNFAPFSLTDLSNEDYHADRQFESTTGLKEILRSPAHYRYYKDNPRTETGAFRLGTAIHTALLEPARFKQDYVVMPTFDGRTKEGKQKKADFIAQHPSACFVTETEMDMITGIAMNVGRHRDAMALLKRGQSEISHFWRDEETGIYMKCRSDSLSDICILDVKSTEDASPNEFIRSCARYDYDMAAYIYSEGVRIATGKARPFAFLVVEKKPPYQVALYFASEEMLASGLYRYQMALKKLKEARDANKWSGYQPEGRGDKIEWPYWAFNRA
jgi:hypothetical protein